jgi:hypothetical protein
MYRKTIDSINQSDITTQDDLGRDGMSMWKSQQDSLVLLMNWRAREYWSATIILPNIVFFCMTDEMCFPDRDIPLQTLLLRYTTHHKKFKLYQRPHSYPHFIKPYSCCVRILSVARQMLIWLSPIHGCFAVNSSLNFRQKYCRNLISFYAETSNGLWA